MEGIMEGENNSLLITMSNDEIFELVSATHDGPDQEENTIVDLDTLFWDSEEIVRCSFWMILNRDSFTKRSKYLVDPVASFSTSLWTFVKSIGLEMSCEDGGDEIITLESRTLQVLKKLSKYSWEAKVVLAMASFALEYIQSDLLNKSVGILKQSIDSTNPDKGKHPVLEAIQLIRRTLALTRDIFLLHCGLSCCPLVSPPKPVVNEMTDIKIPVQVYWLIASIVASATQIKLVTCQEQKRAHDLSQFFKKLDYFFVYQDAERMLSTWRQEKDTENNYHGVFVSASKIRPKSSEYDHLAHAMEVFRVMILPKDITVQTLLIDGSTNQPVDMDVLRWRPLLLLFSGLDISEESDLSPLKKIYEGTKVKDSHKIVWIPMVESWTEDRQKQYEKLRSKMPWYIVQCSSPLTTGMRFIKKAWKFKGKPILVVMNKYGAVKNINALPLIREKGMDDPLFHA